MSKELPGFSSRAVQLPPTPSGLVLGTKLGTVKLTPGEGPKDPGIRKIANVCGARMGKNTGPPARGFCADLFATNQRSRRGDKPNFSTVQTGEIGLLERELPENTRHQYFTLQHRPILQIQF